jgi:hypothetical protein
MGFSNQARINLNSKALQAGVLDGNSASVWYETFFPFGFLLAGESVFTEMARLKALPAGNLATAQGNAASNTDLIQDKSASANAIRLTLVTGTNQTTYAAYSTYNDTTSALLENWLLPQLVPQSTGAPSNGYSIRLFNGDPNAGGTEITTTDGTTGTGESKSVGWIWNYARGLLLLSSDFFTETSINPVTFDPYVNGFRYVGTTAGSGAASDGSTFTATAGETVATGDVVRFDLVTNPGRILKAQANSSGNSAVCGIVKTGVSAGASATVYTGGNIPIGFQVGPASSLNGAPIYLDPSNAGKGTTTIPSSAGQTVFQIGHLTGGNGSTTTPTAVVALQRLYDLG